MLYFLKRKSDATKATEKFLADMAPYGTIKRMRTDNGGEYSSRFFRDLLAKNKIAHEFSAPHSPHQNGTAEVNWRTIFEMARCLLLEAQLPKQLWNHAVRTAMYIRNRCYNPRIGMTAFEAITSRKPNLSNMHTFGAPCHAYIQDKKKLDPRSKPGIFIGYDNQSPAYNVYYPDEHKIQRVRCVKFNPIEKVRAPAAQIQVPTVQHLVSTRSEPYQSAEMTANPEPPAEVDEPPSVQEDAEGGNSSNEAQASSSSSDESDYEEANLSTTDDPSRRYPQRSHKPPKYLADYTSDDSDSAKVIIDYIYMMSDVPKTYNEAVKSDDAEQWQMAMMEEITALEENDTYEVSPLPKDRTAVAGRWVYQVKEQANGQKRYKARYCAKGFKQVRGIDFSETFSPTARMSSIRLLLQLAVQNDYTIHQMDVQSAYLNAPIDHTIYVEQPLGFSKTGDNGEKLYLKLNKSLYGLKQSGRNWNMHINKFLISLGFTQSLTDNCVYVKGNIILIIWVDDIIIAAPNLNEINKIKSALSEKFRMKDLGLMKYFLGIEFHYQKNQITMNQTKYVNKILERFGMQNCNPKSTPIDSCANKNFQSNSNELGDSTLYREIVGSLIYVMNCTRPDLCYTVSKLSQKLSKPTNEDLNMAKRALKYLKGTANHGLTFKKLTNLELTGYSDSDWGGSVDRKSISGNCFSLGENSTLISWRSKKQNTVALSTCESEYCAITESLKEALFLKQLLVDMVGKYERPVLLFVDNQGAIELSRNPVFHQRTKHIDIKYHFIRSHVENKFITLKYIPSANNLADPFTKPITKLKLQQFKLSEEFNK